MQIELSLGLAPKPRQPRYYDGVGQRRWQDATRADLEAALNHRGKSKKALLYRDWLLAVLSAYDRFLLGGLTLGQAVCARAEIGCPPDGESFLA